MLTYGHSITCFKPMLRHFSDTWNRYCNIEVHYQTPRIDFFFPWAMDLKTHISLYTHNIHIYIYRSPSPSLSLHTPAHMGVSQNTQVPPQGLPALVHWRRLAAAAPANSAITWGVAPTKSPTSGLLLRSSIQITKKEMYVCICIYIDINTYIYREYQLHIVAIMPTGLW